MYQIIGSLIAKIGYSLLTERVLKEVFINTAWYLAGKTENKFDDKNVKTIANALDVKLD